MNDEETVKPNNQQSREKPPARKPKKANAKRVNINAPAGEVKTALKKAEAYHPLSKYKPEYAEQLRKFFSPDELYKIIVIGDKEVLMPTPMPFVVDFANEIGVTYHTVLGWGTTVNDDGTPKYPEFFNVYRLIPTYIESLTARQGLMKLTNGALAKFVLQAQCGWRETVNMDVNLTSDGLVEKLKEIGEQKRKESDEMMRKIREERAEFIGMKPKETNNNNL